MDKETYYGVPEYSDTVTVSVGDTAERPTEATGQVRFNTDTTVFEGYDGNVWGSLGDITVNTIDISSITSSTVSTITLDDTHWSDGITWKQIEFEDSMPTVAKVEDMCNDYPALAKAYENFKTFYKLVEQDWIGRQKEDDPPF